MILILIAIVLLSALYYAAFKLGVVNRLRYKVRNRDYFIIHSPKLF